MCRKTVCRKSDSMMKVSFHRIWSALKIMSDPGTNFIIDKFRKFCNKLNIEEALSSSYHHQNSGQVKSCICFEKHTKKKVYGCKHLHQSSIITDKIYTSGTGAVKFNHTIVQQAHHRSGAKSKKSTINCD